MEHPVLGLPDFCIIWFQAPLSPEGTWRCVLPSLQAVCPAGCPVRAPALILPQLRPAGSLPLRAPRPARLRARQDGVPGAQGLTVPCLINGGRCFSLFSLAAVPAAETDVGVEDRLMWIFSV